MIEERKKVVFKKAKKSNKGGQQQSQGRQGKVGTPEEMVKMARLPRRVHPGCRQSLSCARVFPVYLRTLSFPSPPHRDRPWTSTISDTAVIPTHSEFGLFMLYVFLSIFHLLRMITCLWLAFPGKFQQQVIA